MHVQHDAVPSPERLQQACALQVEDFYFSSAAGRARIVLGNRRWGENGYVASGRQQARPVQRTPKVCCLLLGNTVPLLCTDACATAVLLLSAVFPRSPKAYVAVTAASNAVQSTGRADEKRHACSLHRI